MDDYDVDIDYNDVDYDPEFSDQGQLLNGLTSAAFVASARANTAIQRERLRSMQLQREQRETAYLKKLLGSGAATYKRRLRLAGILPGVGMGLVGGLAGLLLANKLSGARDKKHSALLGGAVGAGAGVLISGIANSIARAKGSLSNVSDRELVDGIKNLDTMDYITPGRAAYLEALLEKSMEEREGREWRPKQYIV